MARLLTEKEYIERYVKENVYNILFKYYKKKYPKIEYSNDLPFIEKENFKIKFNILLEKYLNNKSIINHYKKEYYNMIEKLDQAAKEFSLI